MLLKRDGRQRTRERHIVIDDNLCYSCGACVAVCPPNCIFLDNLRLTIDDDACTRCERCTVMCPVQALSMG
jgi:MinD superfamily P-loop ATPase